MTGTPRPPISARWRWVQVVAGQRPRGLSGFAAYWCSVLLVGLLFAPLPRVLDTPLIRYAFDFTHTPLFAAIFLATRWLLQLRLRRPGIAAAAVSGVAGALSELLQSATPKREASWNDFALDLLGVAMAWTGVWCWRRRKLWRAAHTAAIVAFIVTAGWLIDRQAVIRHAWAAMVPLLAGFEQPRDLDRWHAKAGTTIARVQAAGMEGAWALQIRCSDPARYPGVSIQDFESDWRPYRWLEWSVRLATADPMKLTIRIDDDQDEYGERYTARLWIVPPQQVYRIDLLDVAARFREHPMNMAVITELHFFLDEPKAPHTFLLDNVRLVR